MSRGLAAFVAGFGTGYLNSKEKQKDRERQEKMDKIALDRAAREEDEYNRNKAVDEEIGAVPEYDYGRASKREMSNEDVRKMVGGSDDPNAENYVDDQAAEHYRKNVTGADQVNRNASYYAKEGVSKLGGNETAVQGADGSVQMADKQSARQRNPWEILEEKARVGIMSGLPQKVEAGKALMAQAATIKSEAILRGAQEAFSKNGEEGLAEFVSNWDNRDFPYSDIRSETKDGQIAIYGKDSSGKERVLDKAALPEGMTAGDYLLMRVQGLAKPEEMFKYQLQQIQFRREDTRNAKQDKVTEAQLALSGEQLKGAQIDNQTRGARNQAALEQTRVQTEKARAGSDAEKLPEKARIAKWWTTATPEERQAFNETNEKGLKIINDQASGGFLIVDGNDLTRMDPKGILTPVTRPDGSAPAAPAGLPPGAKQVGTKGGKPVYEYKDADGNTKRVIQQ